MTRLLFPRNAFLALAFCTALGGATLPVSAQSSLRSYPTGLGYTTYYDQRRTLYALLGTDQDDIVMLGDDFADRGVWAESYGDPRLKNRGVDGDNLSGLNYRLDDVIAGKPAKIFLSIGKRDLNAGVSPRVASDGLGEIVARIQRASDRTRVYIIGILPDVASDSTDIVRYREYNRLSSQIPRTQYIDLWPVMTDQKGALRPSFYYGSSRRLNGQGYKTVVEALQPYLGASVLDTLGVFPPDSLRGYIRERNSFVQYLPASPDDILMIGNSITQGGEWDELFDDPRVKNRGISSDVTDGIRARLPRMLRGKPRKVFLMAGINDLGNPPQKTPEYTLNNILETVRDIHRLSPGTQVYLQSILPVNPTFPTFGSHTVFSREIVEINRRLAEEAAANGYVFIDLHSRFVDADGYLDPRYTNDGLHLTGEGYRLWRELLIPYVRETNTK